jgi:hypothetical protein
MNPSIPHRYANRPGFTSAPATAPAGDDDIMTQAECAAWLKVSARTIRERTRLRLLPVVRGLGVPRYSKSQIISGRVPNGRRMDRVVK